MNLEDLQLIEFKDPIKSVGKAESVAETQF